MESSRSTSPCSSRETIVSSSWRAASKLNASTAGNGTAFLSCIRFLSGSRRHKRPNMGGGGARQRIQVIAALQRRYNAAEASAASDIAEPFGGPGIIVFNELKLGQGIVTVGIEAGGDEDQLRIEAIQCRQQRVREGAAEFCSAGTRRQREIDDMGRTRLA